MHSHNTGILRQMLSYIFINNCLFPYIDPLITIQNVCEIIKDLEQAVLSKLFVSCGVYSPSDHPVSGEQQRDAMVYNYVNWFPLRSWRNLAAGLHEVGQVELSKHVQSKYLLGMFIRKSLRQCFSLCILPEISD